MSDTVYYVVETVAQSHETDRTDLTNEDVLTLPVVDGPFDSRNEAIGKGMPLEGTMDDYSVVQFHEEQMDD